MPKTLLGSGEAYSWSAQQGLAANPGEARVDLNTVMHVIRRPSDRPGADWCTGDAWLAGGTWLFSEPQPTVRRLVNLTELGWPSLMPDAGGLEIGATCTIRHLHEFVPAGRLAGRRLVAHQL